MPKIYLPLAAIILAGLAALVLPASPARADFDPTLWTQRKLVTLPGEAGTLAYVTVDHPVWAASPDGRLQSLRLIAMSPGDGQPTEIGTQLAAVTDPPAQLEHAARPRFYNLASNQTETVFCLDAGDRPAAVNRLAIDTPSTSFRRAVQVEASDDQQKWLTLRADGAILDFSGDVRLHYHDIKFPTAAEYRYYRVTITNGAEEPLKITGAELALETPQAKTPVAYTTLAPANVTRAEDKSKWTRLTLDLGAENLPLNRVTLQASGQNFWRPIRILATTGVFESQRNPWRAVASGVFFSFSTSRYQRVSDPIRLDDCYTRYVCIEIDNGDNPPLEGLSATVEALPRRLYFPVDAAARQAAAASRLYLYYGQAEARAPSYDFARVWNVLSEQERAQVLPASLGPQVANPSWRQPADARSWLEKNPWAIYFGLSLAVLILGALAIRVFRQTQNQ